MISEIDLLSRSNTIFRRRDNAFYPRRVDLERNRNRATTTQSDLRGAFQGFVSAQITTVDIGDNRPIFHVRDDHQWAKSAGFHAAGVEGKSLPFFFQDFKKKVQRRERKFTAKVEQ